MIRCVRVKPDEPWEYQYDAGDRLVQIDRDGLEMNRYLYDGDGNRVAKLGPDDTGTIFIGNYYEATYYSNTIPDPPPPVVEGGNDLNAVVPSGISYYYAGSQRIAMRTGQGAYLLFSDHLGSTSVVMDAGGQIVEKGFYMPWGGQRGDQGISTTDYGYTGLMKEGDIYYYGARWYDPAIGRFMQADTIVPADIQGTQAFDRYAYVNNNPLKYTDPTGNYACNTNGDCFINGWNKDYLVTQVGNTCNIVSMAMAMSILTGVRYDQSDIQPFFPLTKWIGVLPLTLSAKSSVFFSDKIRTSVDFDGNFEKINNNLENDLPTIVLFGSPDISSIGHYSVVIGRNNDGYIFADPWGYESDEALFIKDHGASTGLDSFYDIWGYDGQFLINDFTMITVSPAPNNWLHRLTNFEPWKFGSRVTHMSMEMTR